MTRRRAALLLMAAGLGGCATATSPRASALTALFAPAPLARVEQLAPDLLARARRARAEAEQQPDPALQPDDELRARLLLMAAQAEADRIELAQQAAVLEVQADAAQLARANAQRARAAEQEAAQLERARQASLQRARAAFAVLMQDSPPQRASHATGRAALGAAPAPDAEAAALARAQAGDFLLERARLITAAATQLGADPEALGRAHAAIAAAQRASTPEAGSRAVQTRRSDSSELLPLQLTALLDAQRALGSARASQPATSGEQTRDLLERMQELGLDARADLGGVAVHLPDAFPPASARPQRLTQPRFALLSAALCAFPAGALQISVHVPADVAHAAALAQARAKQLQAWLGQQLDVRRFSVAADVTSPGAEAESITLILPAYVPPAIGP